jgi:hypothetical protein
MDWSEQADQMVYSKFIFKEDIRGDGGSNTIGRVKPEAKNGVIWKTLQARGLTQHLPVYTGQTCAAFHSRACWEMLNILFDQGVRPPPDFLHQFFRNSAIGPMFMIFPQFPEYAAGLDRLAKLG